MPAPADTTHRMPSTVEAACAIDFGTSNSALAVLDRTAGMRLVELEPGAFTMPTAVFYLADADADSAGRPDSHAAPSHPPRLFGRAAIAAYVDGIDGRLMRSMKSILGSSLLDQTTDVGAGRSVRYRDVVADYLRHLKQMAEAQAGAAITHAVLGRPVFFVDDDPARDAQAQAALEAAARAVGFRSIDFQYEPIAAAFDFERGVQREQIVLVADIGGGTSDFSVVRVGPRRAAALDRKADILANHGVHVAGTDFDRRIELGHMLGELGYRAFGPAIDGAAPREVPSGVYFDLATWHLINTVYQPQRVAELRTMRGFYADPRHHRRLMTVLDERLGHDLVARAESAKIAVADGGAARIALDLVEPGLHADLDETRALQAIEDDMARIAEAARATVARAGLAPAQLDALYFTGGSTGLRLLAQRIAAQFPAARTVHGDRFASVANGLALHAARRFGLASGASAAR
ncbi:MAG TPA: Hsp70 family protein [Burkholderiaceae bacterium]|nr:Hsp70 family protein [Burkholderiaceae bacterium]